MPLYSRDMFVHLNLRRTKCMRASRDAGRDSEFYFTWRVALDGGDDVQLAQGFSLGCPIDDGYTMRGGQTRDLNDPRFTVELPAVGQGETKRATITLFAWESDRSTEEVKKLFTNAAAQKLVQVHKKHKDRKAAAKAEILDFVQDGDNEILTALAQTGVVAANIATPYVTVAKAAVKVLSLVLSAIRGNSDDYLGSMTVDVMYTRTEENKLEYRWIFNDGAEAWFDDERYRVFQSWRCREANGNHELDSHLHLQVVSGSPDEME